VDDYYKVSFTIDNLLEVDIPIYNKKFCTNDEFIISSDGFYHDGRSDLIRINGHVVDVESHNKILKVLKPYLDAKFVYDPAVNEIYLAIWKTTLDPDVLVQKINFKIGTMYWGHHISKYEVLDSNLFFNGIKLDNQLMRDYFRSRVERKSSTLEFILEHKEEYLKIFEGLES
jgi:hypothetical protein